MITLALLVLASKSGTMSLEINPLPIWALGGFERVAANPILKANLDAKFHCPMRDAEVEWEAGDVFNPASTVHGGKLCVLYRAEDASATGIGSRTSRIGLAQTSDGWTLQKRPEPVLFPAKDKQKEYEWPGGCEDPRVAMSPAGLYVMTYTEWNRKIPQLAIATSKDLVHWRKYGPAFRDASGGKYLSMGTKSASIVTQVVRGRQVIAKLNGKYWMYWGEDAVHAATSTDLTSWTPVEDEDGDLMSVIQPRPGFFDSDLTECGPPAVVTPEGIVLIYNGKNRSGTGGDPRFGANSYCAGQILTSIENPMVAKQRLPVPFFRPMEEYERSGQYVAGTVFTEGLSFYKNRWYLFYGCADSRVSVAIFDPRRAGTGDPIPSRGERE